MTSDFRFLMISAMYENGGNTTHRFLDGHPELFVYPFESQPGTKLVQDHLTSMFPVKYRWPVFALDAGPEADYASIIDEECKVRARTPQVSKFRHMPFDFSDDERRRIYCGHVRATGRSRGANVAAFFRATFEAWKDHRKTGREKAWVGYSPIIGVDADKIVADLPGAHVLHVVRNPWSAFADTSKRAVPLSLAHYALAWSVCQQTALHFQKTLPGRVHVVRLEDVLEDPKAALAPICAALGVGVSDTLKTPSWNGQELREVYPWGTIREATPDANRRTAAELTPAQTAEIRARTAPFLDLLGYANFV